MLQKQIQSSIKIFSKLILESTHDGIFQAIESTNYHIKQLAGNDLVTVNKNSTQTIRYPNKIKLTISKFKFHVSFSSIAPKFLCSVSSNFQDFAVSASHFSSLTLAFPLPFESSTPSLLSFALPPRRLG